MFGRGILLVLLALAGPFAVAETLTVPKTLFHRCYDLKDAGSCYQLADLYGQTKAAGDESVGAQYGRYGCKLESKRACSKAEVEKRQADFLKTKREWQAGIDKALQEMPSVKTPEELACESGKAEACDVAAIHYRYLGRILNPAKAKALDERGCALGNKKCCDTLVLVRKGIIHVYDVEL